MAPSASTKRPFVGGVRHAGAHVDRAESGIAAAITTTSSSCEKVDLSLAVEGERASRGAAGVIGVIAI